MKRILITLASLLGLLVGCAAPTQNPIPTPYPPEYLPTVIVLTAEAANGYASATALAAIPTDVPAETPEPSDTPEPTLTFTPMPTYTSTAIPGHELGAIRFVTPGPMSKVISPIQVRANVIAGASERVQIDLYGEDGRLLARELRKLLTTSEGALLSIKIPFETEATAELGRITISTFDKEGRITALNSVRILLLSSGVNEINPVGNPSEPVGLLMPLDKQAIFGGVLNVKGDIWPFNLQPVILELIDPAGKSIALRIITLNFITPQLFETTIPYKVSEPVAARLIIRQDDDRMPGVFYVYSQEVLLNP